MQRRPQTTLTQRNIPESARDKGEIYGLPRASVSFHPDSEIENGWEKFIGEGCDAFREFRRTVVFRP